MEGAGDFEAALRDTFEIRSVACSVESARGFESTETFGSAIDPAAEPPVETAVDLGTEPRTEADALFVPSILLIPNAHLSNMGLEPYDDPGEGRGCEPVINTLSDLGV